MNHIITAVVAIVVVVAIAFCSASSDVASPSSAHAAKQARGRAIVDKLKARRSELLTKKAVRHRAGEKRPDYVLNGRVVTLPGHRGADSNIAAAIGADTTKTPYVQPSSQVAMISNWCKESWTLLEADSLCTEGGWVQPPAYEINAGESGSFIAAPPIGSDNCACSATYFTESGTAGPFAVFIDVNNADGEWMCSVQYPTVSDIALDGETPIGRRAIYTIISGNPLNMTVPYRTC